MAHRRRHRRNRRHYSNPPSVKALLAQPKELIKPDFAMEAVAVAGGFVMPGIVMNYVPAGFRDAPWKFYLSKVAVISALATAATMVKPRIGRMVLLGGGVSLIMDLFQTVMTPAVPTPAPAAAGAYYGPGIHAYYGDIDTAGMGRGTGELVDDTAGSGF